MTLIPQTTFSTDNATDASFRISALTMSTTLASIGLVKTANTGQIDLTTATKTSTINTAVGYEIWRFNDTLHNSGGRPVFIKVEYGCGGNTGLTSMWFTVGTGTDGGANLTGQVSARQQVGTFNGAATGNFRASGSTNRMLAWAWSTNNLFYHTVSIERSRDDAGNESSEGIIFIIGAALHPGGWRSQFIPYVGSVPSAYSYVPAPHPGASSTFGANVLVAPVFPIYGKLGNPGINFGTIFPSDIGLYALFPATMYGVARQYIAYASNDIYGVGPGGLTGNTQLACSLAMLAE